MGPWRCAAAARPFGSPPPIRLTPTAALAARPLLSPVGASTNCPVPSFDGTAPSPSPRPARSPPPSVLKADPGGPYELAMATGSDPGNYVVLNGEASTCPSGNCT